MSFNKNMEVTLKGRTIGALCQGTSWTTKMRNLKCWADKEQKTWLQCKFSTKISPYFYIIVILILNSPEDIQIFSKNWSDDMIFMNS